MPQVINATKVNRSQYLKRTSRRENEKTRSLKSGTNGTYNVIVEDIVIDYNVPKNDDVIESTVQKRKLPNDDDYDWDWAPYRKLKSQRSDVSVNEINDYLSVDEYDDSQIVPDWDGGEPESSCQSYSDDDSMNSKAIQMVTIDEVIEFDTIKSTNFHHFDDESICFDIGKYCEMADDVEEASVKNGKIDKQNDASDVVRAVTNNQSRLVLCEDDQKVTNEVKPHTIPFDCNHSDGVDNFHQWETDCQIEEFKFARCFKCRRKVYVMENCPQHFSK